ncbi:hypothetical protein D4764_08G0006590 [Takifugu flavidus]|uniref:Secreted protein n=1 Tax=Takifugu flavidus TaxID=433684 RepID=A0A5C6MNC7_9TELE|nr:hypothetical protein D4764_08G0006590 [Takifugu flavidus]
MESPSSGSEHTRSLALVLLSCLAARCLLYAPPGSREVRRPFMPIWPWLTVDEKTELESPPAQISAFTGIFQVFGEPLPRPSSWVCSVAMAANREQQVGHMTSFPPAVYPFAFNPMRSRSPFDLLANSSLFGRFGADLPKEMAALCKYYL